MEEAEKVILRVFFSSNAVFTRNCDRYIDDELKDLYDKVYKSELVITSIDEDRKNLYMDVHKLKLDFKHSLRKYLSQKSVDVETVQTDKG